MHYTKRSVDIGRMIEASNPILCELFGLIGRNQWPVCDKATNETVNNVLRAYPTLTYWPAMMDDTQSRPLEPRINPCMMNVETLTNEQSNGQSAA